MAVPPYRDWPGADGVLTGNMWAWWFPTRPAFLGPVPLKKEPDHRDEMVDVIVVDVNRPRAEMGQDFSLKPTPPPCSLGYIPVINHGVMMCIPGTPGSGMMAPMNPMPQGRTFPVKAWFGWKEI